MNIPLIHEALRRIAAWRDLGVYKCNCEEDIGVTCNACTDMEKVDQALESMENPNSSIPDSKEHYVAILVNALKLSNDDMTRLVRDLTDRGATIPEKKAIAPVWREDEDPDWPSFASWVTGCCGVGPATKAHPYCPKCGTPVDHNSVDVDIAPSK
jgi:hypothetical protein